jgi:putative membrane protein
MTDNTERLTQHFLNERTFLAWIRASTALMVFGYAVARFAVYLDAGADERRSGATYFGGLAMTFAGLVTLVLSTCRYWANGRGIDSGREVRTHEGYVYTFAVLVGVTGLLLLVLLMRGGM